MLMNNEAMERIRGLAKLEEIVDYSLNPEYVAKYVGAAIRYIEALEADYKRRGVDLPGWEVTELADEEIAEMTGYKCPVCQHHKLCTTPNLKPLCGETYTHFEPKVKAGSNKVPAGNLVSDAEEMNFDSSIAPVWQLPVTSGEDGPVGVRGNVKYHCFVDDHALCNGRHQNTEDFDDGITIESAAVLEQPQLVCKKCLAQWKRMFQIEG